MTLKEIKYWLTSSKNDAGWAETPFVIFIILGVVIFLLVVFMLLIR